MKKTGALLTWLFFALMVTGLTGCALKPDSPLSRADDGRGTLRLDDPTRTRASRERADDHDKKAWNDYFPFTLFTGL